MNQKIGHYQINRKIGKGGMAEIFLADDTRLNRKVALKFLSPGMMTNKCARLAFFREAKAIAAISHPNIVTVYEINESGPYLFIAMEYVDGDTLKGKRFKVGAIIDIAGQICEGMSEAHQKGVIHRDIKPQNIILNPNNRVKIFDFGVAEYAESAASQEAGQEPREVCHMGSIRYLSPEQVQGDTEDLRTDIWSLGVLLYELVTGELPFNGDSEEEIFKSILFDTPKQPSEMVDNFPLEFETIILKCLSKDVEARYSSMQHVFRDLELLREKLKGIRVENLKPSLNLRGIPFRHSIKPIKLQHD